MTGAPRLWDPPGSREPDWRSLSKRACMKGAPLPGHVLCSSLCGRCVLPLCIRYRAHPGWTRCTQGKPLDSGATAIPWAFSKPPPSASRPPLRRWFSIAYHNCLATLVVNG